MEKLRRQAELSVLGLRRLIAGGLLVGLVLVGFSVQVLGLFYPEQRYYQLMAFYEQRPAKPWWTGSIPFASLDFLGGFVAETQPSARAAGAVLSSPTGADPKRTLRSNLSEEEFLRSFPNSENLTLPDLLFAKARYLGLPAALVYAYLGLSILMGAAGVIGIRKYAVRNEP
jgi:hypothetical protein